MASRETLGFLKRFVNRSAQTINHPSESAHATPATASGSDLDALFAADGSAEIALPRRLVTGDGALARLGEALGALAVPAGPVLVVADRVLVDLGPAAAAVESLRGAGYEPSLYADVAREPDLEMADGVVAAVRAAPYVAVVGIGGGSAMDPAKLASALATNAGAVADYVTGGRPVAQPPLPLALVPTTAGTGAEASRNSVVTHDGRKHIVGSPLLAPSLAVLDPLLVVSCPPAVTAASGLDALAHAVEAALSTWATPFTTLNAVAAVAAIGRWLPAAVEDGADLPARRATLCAAHLAGVALNASALVGHSLAYTIARRTHLPHGVTTAMALPYCVAYNADAAAPQLRLLGRAVGVEAEGFAAWVQALAVDLGLPRSLADVGIPEEELPAMVDECLTDYPRPNNPRPLERESLLQLCRRLHSGELRRATEALA